MGLETTDKKNEPLNMNFRRENGYIEGGGFRFRVEQAMCSEELGISYFYISVTDISGQGRNPKDYIQDNTEKRGTSCMK